MSEFDEHVIRTLAVVEPWETRGRVCEAIGGLIKAKGVDVPIGEVCELHAGTTQLGIAEVVGFSAPWCFLTPLGAVQGLSPRVEVVPTGTVHRVMVGDSILGRVVNGYGVPIDERGPLNQTVAIRVDAEPPQPLSRQPVRESLVTGVRAIDGLLSCGVGQRVGIFAPPGVGKSTLMSTLACRAQADTVVVALVGERGREVGDFVRVLQTSGRFGRTVVVAATSDRPAIERVKAAQTATAIAEHFRDRGQHVLLFVDSLTRLARAQREIGLAMGEPPTRRGFPPSVFSTLPRLLERTGCAAGGAISAFYSVLVEGEEIDDPIGEEVKSILDGHISLTRELSMAGHFPAIDILGSVSRVMDRVVTPTHRELAGRARQLLARFRDIEMLVQLGEYVPGKDAESDRALAARPALQAFLQQEAGDAVTTDSMLHALAKALQS